MMDAATTVATAAIIANICAVASGWTVLARCPELLRQTAGKAFNFSPAYLCFAIVMLTTGMSMFLSVLLWWWFTQPEIRSSNTGAAVTFMAYHMLTGVTATAIHVLIAVFAAALLEPKRVGGIKDADAAKGLARAL